MDLLHIFDLTGTAAFAITGALVGIQKKMDIFGMIVLAVVTAMGGGILRSTMIGDYPIAFLSDVSYLLTAVIATLCVFLLHQHLVRYKRTILVADALGLGIFLSIGVSVGLANGYEYWASILLGVITACFGGVIRDVLSAQVPLIFKKELYATAAFAGGVLYVTLYAFNIRGATLIVLASAAATGLRLLSMKYDWQLPHPKRS